MDFMWKKIAKTVYRLDATWQAVEETPGQWRVYRDCKALLEEFATLTEVIAECERLRKSHTLYEARG